MGARLLFKAIPKIMAACKCLNKATKEVQTQVARTSVGRAISVRAKSLTAAKMRPSAGGISTTPASRRRFDASTGRECDRTASLHAMSGNAGESKTVSIEMERLNDEAGWVTNPHFVKHVGTGEQTADGDGARTFTR